MGCKRHGKSSSGGGVAAVAAVVVGVAMASGAHHGKPGDHPAVVADAVAPPPPPATRTVAHGAFPGRRAWAADFLRAAGLPVTTCNVNAITAQAAAENSNARFNPLDTERQEPGNTLYNSAGVRNYVSLAQGLHATVVTLYNGHYPGVIAALRAGHNAEAVARAIWVPHVWGTQPFSASC
jgi:hypothetical protein